MTLAQIVYIQSKYTQNQVVHYFRKSIYRQFTAFWTKKILVSTLYIMDGILCGDIKTERSKI